MKKRRPSKLENRFLWIWKALKGPTLTPEHRFHPDRKWRFDFAIPSRMMAIEIEGGIFSGGRHTRGIGFANDCEKYNTATAMGWTVFRLTQKQIKGTDVTALIEFARREI